MLMLGCCEIEGSSTSSKLHQQIVVDRMGPSHCACHKGHSSSFLNEIGEYPQEPFHRRKS